MSLMQSRVVFFPPNFQLHCIKKSNVIKLCTLLLCWMCKRVVVHNPFEGLAYHRTVAQDKTFLTPSQKVFHNTLYQKFNCISEELYVQNLE